MTQIPRSARYGLVAAVALVAIFLGATFFGKAPNGTGGPGASATATLAPTPDPSAKSLLDFGQDNDLKAGSYFLDQGYPARIEVTVPEGWWHWYDSTSAAASGVQSILVDNHFGDGSTGWGIAFPQLENVRVDPCVPSAGLQDPGVLASSASLADAIAAWPGFSATVTNTTLGGYSGKHVEVSRQPGEQCPSQTLFVLTSLWSFPGSFATADPVNQFYLLDVQGSVLVIWTTDYPDRNEYEVAAGMSPDPTAHVADQQALHAILDSLRIIPR